jgi:ATP-binding cassette subfamily B protein
MRMLFTLTAGQRYRYLIAMVAMTLGIGVEYLVPMFGQAVIDSLSTLFGEQEPGRVTYMVRLLGGAEGVVAHLGMIAVVMLGVTAVGGLLNYVAGRQTVKASENVVAALREQLHDHIQHLPCSYHDEHATGDLVQRCVSDVETIRQFLAVYIGQIARSLVLVAAVVPLMLSLSVKMTGVAMCMTLPVIAFSCLFFRKARSAFQKADEAEGKISSRLQENLTGIRVVRAFARQEHEKARFDEANHERRYWNYRLYTLMALFWSMSDFLGVLQLVLILGLGSFWVLKGGMTLGMLYLFVTWTWKYVMPLRQLGRVLTELGKAQVAMGRVLEILHVAPEQAVAGFTEAPLDGCRGGIEFRDVTFAYGGETPVLQSLSFAVEPGETIALLGASGSGKTTVLSLLLRFYDVEGGAVLLDGHDVRSLQRRDLRGKFGVALQNPFLYSRSVGDNIRVAHGSASDLDMHDAARSASLHDAVMTFSEEYDTMVGERGVTLSGGQRQRVSLARALIRQSPILLLDDTLSAVDSETEHHILQALEERHGHRTTIVVAHRLSTLRIADRILVFEKGHIIQSGSHAELVAVPGLYRRLWDLQADLESGYRTELAEAGLTGERGDE